MKNLFLIGEMSKLFQIDIRTLRYYDEIDLFKPVLVDDKTGYRYYSIEQFEQLNTILYLKQLNISLKNIKSFLGNRDIDQILLLLTKQQQEIKQKIEEFLLIQKKIENRISQIVDATQEEKLNHIRKIYLPKRTIFFLKQRIGRNDNLEMPIRVLENNTNMKSTIFLGKVGLSVSINNLRMRNFEEYNSIFVIVENENNNIREEKVLPKGTYITFRFVGHHKDAPAYYDKVMDYIEENKYEILDDAIEITLIDYGLTNDPLKFITEIQVLIKSPGPSSY